MLFMIYLINTTTICLFNFSLNCEIEQKIENKRNLAKKIKRHFNI